MESTTYLKNLKVAPKKLRFYLPVIKKMTPAQAAEMLYYEPNKPARTFYQAIKSAISNAKSYLKVNEDLLQFKLLTVEEGIKLKRYNPGARGTAKPYVKRFAHIKIVLGASQPVIVDQPKSKVKKDEKAEAASDAEVAKEPAAKKPAARRRQTKVTKSKE